MSITAVVGIKEEAVSKALAKAGLTIDETSDLLDLGYTPGQIATGAYKTEKPKGTDDDGYKIIARANGAKELANTKPSVSTLPKGTRGRVVIDGLGWTQQRLFDMAYAEQLFGKKLVPAHCKLLDVRSEGSKGIVEFEVTGSPVIPILVAIALVLVALGIAAASISVGIIAAKSPETLGEIATGTSMAVIAVVALVIYYWWRSSHGNS